MDPTERWQRIESILDAALDAEPAEREALVRAACGTDEALRAEVDKLLAACVASEGFMEQPAHLEAAPMLDAVDAAAAAANHLSTGHRIGPYRILKTIGRGGMGVVYLAERADGTYEQAVALKVVKRGTDTDEVVQRFRYERQILARLEHPHIARLLDGGVTDADATTAGGLPYFVMEHVEGEPIDTYCTTHQCTLRERLALFATVCEAVQFAHRNLVVHRDLKPSNILVRPPAPTKQSIGEVKLLDFGIAKVLGAEEEDAPFTRTQTRRLTPEYAAPEQVTGDPATPATDVYALGVILYELLTGQHPYVIKSRRWADLEAAICDTVPARPSTAVLKPGAAAAQVLPAKQLRRQLSGDLDAIILKALKKEPELRYASAGELLQDVRRYLEGRPVLAQRDTFRYRAGKFIRRNKIGVGAGTFAVLALVIGLVTALWQANRANQEAERARRSFEFVVSTFLNVSPEETQNGIKIDVSDIIKSGEAELATLGDQPLDQAALMDVMGEVCIALNKFADAEGFYTQALTIKRRHFRREDPSLIRSLHGLAVAKFNDTSAYPEAEVLLRQALDIVAQTNADLRLEERDLYNTLGYVLAQQQKREAAKAAYRRALQLSGALLRGADAGPKVREGRIESLEGIATALCAQPDSMDLAETYYHEVIDEKVRLYSTNHSNTARALSYLADCLREKGDYRGSETYNQQALGIYQKVYGLQHIAVAGRMQALAALYADHLNDHTQAERYYRETLAVYDETVEPTHLWRGYALRGLGQLLVDTGKPEEGVALLKESLAVFETHELPPAASIVVAAHFGLGQGHAAMGDYAEARRAYETLLQTEAVPTAWRNRIATALAELPY